jgi:two-component system, sensor histidine kinase and response regulator
VTLLLGDPGSQPAAEALDEIRVVIADDSAAMRMLARYALSPQRGFRLVGEAAHGAEALDLIATHRPDCVVLDIEMPGMGGFEALAELRRRAPQLPVILLSGHGDASTAERAIKEGAVAHLDKTSQFILLADTIRQVVTHLAGTADPVLIERAAADPRHEPAEDAEAVKAELRRLEYVVSHDLGEPLRIMAGFAGLLESRYGAVLDEAGRSFVTHISEGSRRMQEMLADLLTYSRAGQLHAGDDDLDLQILARTVCGELADRILERGAELTVGDLPTAVGDADLVKDVLRHLVVNAITFNTSTVPKVTLSGRTEGSTAVVTVQDNGIGIDPAHRERAFELFQRLNTREAYPGTGTGLALCQRLLTLQQGTIALEAAPEIGTIVTLTLPAAPREGHTTPTHRRSG